jgi:hypothetical protein
MKHKKLPEVEVLNEHLDYDPTTGAIIRKLNGCLAGTTNKQGYRVVMVEGTLYLAHRIVFKMYYRKDPGAFIIDHINGDRSDNRIHNLRKCRKNSKSNARNRRDKGRYVVDDDGVGRWVSGVVPCKDTSNI